MPWVRRHRRRVPGGWFRTTTVRSHFRRTPGGGLGVIGVVVAIAVIVLLIVIF
jgi:hypothetical protein